jgi:hypothetical protein
MNAQLAGAENPRGGGQIVIQKQAQQDGVALPGGKTFQGAIDFGPDAHP